MSAWLDAPVAFVDVETTGCHPFASRIIEIGLVAASAGELQYEWSSLVNPGVAIPASIQHFTGITDEMVRDAPSFEQLADELVARFEGRLFVAHNARFDYGFFRRQFRELEQPFTSRVACTVKLSRRLDPQVSRHSLDAIIERYGLDCERRHRALPDARALWQFWQALRARRPESEIERALDQIIHLRSVPAHLPQELAEELPELPGVYRFHGEGDALLYVGKANNIRTRVLAHWQGSGRDAKSQRLSELTRRVSWIVTAGELGALLLEARLVRAAKPIYNRQLRGCDAAWTWVVADDGAAPELAPVDQIPLSFEHSDTFGLYRTPAAARSALTAIAREHRLCLRMLGLESSAGSCFAYQLGKCAGACVGAEPLRLHTVRLKLALAPQRLKPWPFSGPVGVREVGASGLTQIHVLDRWRHIGTLEEGDSVAHSSSLQPFDIDVYRILVRALRGPAQSQLVWLGRDLDAA
jgi:DNA polymerase III subunit epsilon